MESFSRIIQVTADGSHTLHSPSLNENYHSRHGAVQEAVHVFINAGYHFHSAAELSILEIGFGTGLNALLTCNESIKSGRKVNYVGVEAFPLNNEEINALNYAQFVMAEAAANYPTMMTSNWEVPIQISEQFTLTKRQTFFENITDEDAFDLIYFDAFGFQVQPELWTLSMFQKMYNALKNDGVLVTYACRTPIVKALKEAGFAVSKIPGPIGKREMTRAVKK
jgi:tRNA U34 5-methylaminomethyl-2-thiouridine-forming methyltransferase MnmC